MKVVKIMSDKILEQRTLNQNASLHLWAEQIANAYNEKGMTIEAVIKNFKMELFWTKESVKELIIKTAITRMFGKRSTTQLLRSGEEINKLIDVVTKFNSQMEVEYIPFPSLSEMEYNQSNGKDLSKMSKEV